MTRDDLYTSAVFGVAIGAVLVWFGTKMFRRPVETTQKMLDWLRRGRPAPTCWARAHPEAGRGVLRAMGAVLIALGLAFLVLGACEWWASRS